MRWCGFFFIVCFMLCICWGYVFLYVFMYRLYSKIPVLIYCCESWNLPNLQIRNEYISKINVYGELLTHIGENLRQIKHLEKRQNKSTFRMLSENATGHTSVTFFAQMKREFTTGLSNEPRMVIEHEVDQKKHSEERYIKK
jgi:hypothetical protein